jgi:hypothetical protein
VSAGATCCLRSASVTCRRQDLHNVTIGKDCNVCSTDAWHAENGNQKLEISFRCAWRQFLLAHAENFESGIIVGTGSEHVVSEEYSRCFEPLG